MALPPPFHASDEDIRRMILEQQRGRGPRTGIPQAFAASPPPTPRPAPAPAVAAPPPPVRPPTQQAPAVSASVGPRAAVPAPERNKTAQYLDAIFSGLSGRGGYDQSRYDAMDERASKEHRAAQMADPTSAESAAMRKQMGPMLMQLGLKPEQLQYLSGATLASVGGNGDLVKDVIALQGQAAAAKAKAEADRAALDEQRGYEEAQKRAEREANATAEAAKNKRELEEEGVRDERDFKQQKVIAAISAGAAADRATSTLDAAERARIAAEERAVARKKADEARKSAADAEKAHRAEEVALDDIEARLSKLAPDETIPGQEPPVVQKGYEVRKFFTGGTGRDKAASQLQRDLEQVGAATLKAQRGVLSEADKKDAASLYTGDGTVSGALAAVRARKAKIAAEKVKAQRTPDVVEVDTSGDEWEDVP